jgi:hypothetical protein
MQGNREVRGAGRWLSKNDCSRISCLPPKSVLNGISVTIINEVKDFVKQDFLVWGREQRIWRFGVNYREKNR